jgi:hypothetical protein
VVGMCLRLAVLVVVAVVLLWMYGLDLGRVAKGIVVLPLRLQRDGYDRGFVVAGMLSSREVMRGNGRDFERGWSETRLGCFSETRVATRATQRWRELRVVEVHTRQNLPDNFSICVEPGLYRRQPSRTQD